MDESPLIGDTHVSDENGVSNRLVFSSVDVFSGR